MAAQPLSARQELLQATRRVMGARGTANPIDRLHWLAMRRGLGEVAPLAARPEASSEVAEWLESDVLCVAAYSAFLSRLVPGEVVDAPQGRAWYDAVMAIWLPFAEIPECQPPNAEAMVEALAKMQTLSWMQRPVIVRNWVTTAIAMSRGLRLGDLSADALQAHLRPARFAPSARARAPLHRPSCRRRQAGQRVSAVVVATPRTAACSAG